MTTALSILGAFILGWACGHRDRRPRLVVEVFSGEEAARLKLRNQLKASLVRRAN